MREFVQRASSGHLDGMLHRRKQGILEQQILDSIRGKPQFGKNLMSLPRQTKGFVKIGGNVCYFGAWNARTDANHGYKAS
jgi:hypothetical protein